MKGHDHHQHVQGEAQPIVDHFVISRFGQVLEKLVDADETMQKIAKITEETDELTVAMTSMVVRVTMMRSVKLSTSK